MSEEINLFFMTTITVWSRTSSSVLLGWSALTANHKMKCYRSKQVFFWQSCCDFVRSFNEKGSHVTVSKENTVTQFNAYKKTKPLPVVIYADFESTGTWKFVTKRRSRKYSRGWKDHREHKANSFRIRVLCTASEGFRDRYCLPLGPAVTYPNDKIWTKI
jgi:hypothetical protein